MKKKQILFAIGLTIASVTAYSQNIGVGEPNPGSKLSVKGGMSVGENYSSQTAPAGSLIIEKNVGIGTVEIDSNAILDIRSTTKGIILPRMSKTQRESITNPTPGLFVFDTDSNTLFFSNGNNWFNFPAVDLVNNTVIGVGNTALGGLGGLLGGGSGGSSSGGGWLSGSTVPTALNGDVNDFYINTSNGNYYKKTNSLTWTLLGNLKGPQGDPGPAGINGMDGSNGAPGADGATGATGAAGATWLSGSAAPTGGQGSVNDFYIRTSNGAYYKKTGASTWTQQGSLAGPTGATGATGSNGATGATGAVGSNGAAGATGATGATGAAGTNGATWLSGSSAPTGGQGSMNDFFLNSSNGTYYKKTGASTWTSQGSLKGATGATGATGSNGATGATGPAGSGGTTYVTTTISVSNNSTQNNLNIGSATYIRLSGAHSKVEITGIAGGSAGKTIILYNVSGGKLKLKNENSGSTAANRIELSDGSTEIEKGACMLLYDAVISRWILVSGN